MFKDRKDRDPGMSHADLAVSLFKKAGWRVERVTSDDANLIQTQYNDPLGCGDGRNEYRGPTLFGGKFGVMALATGGNSYGAYTADSLIQDAGFRPTVHTDQHAEHDFKNMRRSEPNVDIDILYLGCGFFKLWRLGKLAGVCPYEFSSGRELYEATMNEKMTFTGDQKEQYLVLNLIEDSTPKPDRSRFRVDAWLAGKLSLDYPLLIINTIQVVQLLGRSRNVVIVDPLK